MFNADDRYGIESEQFRRQHAGVPGNQNTLRIRNSRSDEVKCRNAAGEQFGEHGVLQAVAEHAGRPDEVFDGLLDALAHFHGSAEDYISLLQVVMPERELAQRPHGAHGGMFYVIQTLIRA